MLASALGGKVKRILVRAVCAISVFSGLTLAQNSQPAITPVSTAPADHFKATFFAVSLRSVKIVIIVDASGSMLDGFDGPKAELNRAIAALQPVQYFAVVTTSEEVKMVGPATLLRATPERTKQFADEMTTVQAVGVNSDAMFQKAFEQAFALKPDLIVFVTDGKPSETLTTAIKKLNADKKVHIDTVGIATESAAFKAAMEALSKDYGGEFHFVPEKDLRQK